MTDPNQIEIKIPVDCDEETVEQVKKIALSLCGSVWGYGRKVSSSKQMKQPTSTTGLRGPTTNSLTRYWRMTHNDRVQDMHNM